MANGPDKNQPAGTQKTSEEKPVETTSPEVVWHEQSVSRGQREKNHGHAGCVVWFTGLSGCGKSTVANLVDQKLHAMGLSSFLLDGDNVRHGLNATPAMLAVDHGEAFAQRFGLGFSAEDREENIRRIGEVALLFCSAGLVTLAAFVSPYRADRDAVRRRVEEAGHVGDFIEVYVDAPLAVCESRDPKGLYHKARTGKLTGMTGIDAPYESPKNPELTLSSANTSAASLADEVIAYLQQSGIVPKTGR